MFWTFYLRFVKICSPVCQVSDNKEYSLKLQLMFWFPELSLRCKNLPLKRNKDLTFNDNYQCWLIGSFFWPDLPALNSNLNGAQLDKHLLKYIFELRNTPWVKVIVQFFTDKVYHRPCHSKHNGFCSGILCSVLSQWRTSVSQHGSGQTAR